MQYLRLFFSGTNNQFKNKQRIKNHKSDAFHPQNNFCKKYSEHLLNSSRMKEPFFRIFPFLYKNKKELQKEEKEEKIFIMR